VVTNSLRVIEAFYGMAAVVTTAMRLIQIIFSKVIVPI
jgi:hypothetical protein